MPRRRRIALIGDIIHIMARGLEGRPIFIDDADRIVFVDLLGKNLERGGCACYAWTLMSNHYHLLLRPMNEPAGLIMRRINGAYARYFNRRHKRRGYLFQDRYKSVATREFWYFRELVRYVHLNALRAGVVKNLDALGRYRWSGHRGVMGDERHSWQNVDELLARFGKTPRQARYVYLAFLGEGVGQECGCGPLAAIDCDQDTSPATGKRLLDDRIVGEAAKVRDAVRMSAAESVRMRQVVKNRQPLRDCVRSIAEENKCTIKSILSRGLMSAVSRARSRFCRQARGEGYTLGEIGGFLGMTEAGVVKAIMRAEMEKKP